MGSSLSAQEIDQFIHQGFVKIENAFPENLADAAKEFFGEIWDVIPMIQEPGNNLLSA